MIDNKINELFQAIENSNEYRAYLEIGAILERDKEINTLIDDIKSLQKKSVNLEYNNFEKFKYYCKNNDINIKDTCYTEEIVCKIEMEEDKKERLLKDYELKNINLLDLKVLSKKYIEKSIKK